MISLIGLHRLKSGLTIEPGRAFREKALQRPCKPPRCPADCRLPIADCRLPIADCRLPTAAQSPQTP
ncbi:hypothetical protein A8H35_02625 [Burkholderia thailandensis]|nr:hypothetical protein A8H35_02625 [Burkholderia thailandensis]